MRPLVRWLINRDLRSRDLLFPALVLLAVAVVLLHGALQGVPPAGSAAGARAAPASTGAGTTPGTPAPALGIFRPDLEKAPLAYLSEYWLQLGTRARNGIVLIGPERWPAIVAAPGLALTSVHATAGAGAVAEAEGNAPGPELLAVDPDHELALFRVAGSAQTPFRPVDPEALPPASLVAAVSLEPNGQLEITPAYLVSAPAASDRVVPGRQGLQLSVPPPPSTRVAAVVDLDGRLVGAALGSAKGVKLLSSAELLAIVERLKDAPRCRGFEVTPLAEEVRRLAGVKGGVVVQRVRRPTFSGEAPVRAGDILLQWNAKEVPDAAAFRRLHDGQAPGSAVAVVVWRERRRLSRRFLMPDHDCRPRGEPAVLFPALGATLRWEEGAGPEGGTAPGWKVVAVDAGGRAARTSLAAGDRIVGIDGTGITRDPSRRRFEALGKRRPLLFTVQRGDDVSLLALPPEDEG